MYKVIQNFLIILFIIFLIACASAPIKQEPIQHELTIKIEQVGDNKMNLSVTDNGKEKIIRSMEISDPGMKLSQLSGIANDQLYLKLFSGLSVADVTRTWNDLIYTETKTDIRIVNIFIDSPGGDAFSGLALADQIEKYKKRGFKFIAHATGIVASAAVPVFAVCNETHATEATIFMVHEAALWKWPGRETASQIRSQTRLMDLLQKLYLMKLVRNSNLNFDDWVLLEAKTSWFSAKKAKDIGILDIIDNEHP